MMISKKILTPIFLVSILMLCSCDMGDDSSANGSESPPMLSSIFAGDIKSVANYTFNDLGSNKSSVRTCQQYLVDRFSNEEDRPDFISINAMNDDGFMVGSIWEPSNLNAPAPKCLPFPFAFSKSAEESTNIIYNTATSIMDQSIFLYDQELQSVSNKKDDGSFDVFSAIYFATNNTGNDYIQFLLSDHYSNSSQHNNLMQIKNTPSTQFSMPRILDDLRVSSNGQYLFTTPSGYDVKLDSQVSKLYKSSSDGVNEIPLLLDQDYFGDGDVKFWGTITNVSNNGIVVAFDANSTTKNADVGYRFAAPLICKDGDKGTYACHMMTDFHVNEVERGIFAQISPNGRYIYALKRTGQNKESIDHQFISINPVSYQETVIPLNNVIAILNVFDNGSAIVSDTHQLYYFSPSKKVLEPIINLVKVANISDASNYQLEAVSPNGKYFLLYNSAITEKSADATSIYKIIQLNTAL